MSHVATLLDNAVRISSLQKVVLDGAALLYKAFFLASHLDGINPPTQGCTGPWTNLLPLTEPNCAHICLPH